MAALCVALVSRAMTLVIAALIARRASVLAVLFAPASDLHWRVSVRQ
jgi:hypothetical protein